MKRAKDHHETVNIHSHSMLVLNFLRALTVDICAFELHMTRGTLFVIAVRGCVVSKVDFGDLITDLQPMVARSRNGEESTEEIIASRRDDESTKEVEVVDIPCARRDLATHGTSKANNVDKYACDIGGIASPVKAEEVVVRAALFSAVEVPDLEVALLDKVVIRYDYTSNRG